MKEHGILILHGLKSQHERFEEYKKRDKRKDKFYLIMVGNYLG